MSEVIKEDQIGHWLSRLEELIPRYVNGASDQGELVVEHRYLPNSVRLEEFIQPDEEDSLTLCFLSVSYLVEKRAIEGDTFAPIMNMFGAVHIPVDHGLNLALDDVSFVDGLRAQNR